jgi:hypothetical protein
MHRIVWGGRLSRQLATGLNPNQTMQIKKLFEKSI